MQVWKWIVPPAGATNVYQIVANVSGQSFAEYVEFMRKNNHISVDNEEWVDHIRKKGNEANHEIVIVDREDAEELLRFVEMLLRLIYEFPAIMNKKKTAAQQVAQ